VEAPGLSGFAVRVGYRRPLHRSASGRILLAFQTDGVREAMLEEVRSAGGEIDLPSTRTQIDHILKSGSGATPSPVLTGITDLSVPILTGGFARAALAVPFVDGPRSRVPLRESPLALKEAAVLIASQLEGGAWRKLPKYVKRRLAYGVRRQVQALVVRP
jgi:DNA-binding IclR family transcriptional regulator